MCLRFQFCTHQRVCILQFLNKRVIRCTLVLYTYKNFRLQKVRHQHTCLKSRGPAGGFDKSILAVLHLTRQNGSTHLKYVTSWPWLNPFRTFVNLNLKKWCTHSPTHSALLVADPDQASGSGMTKKNWDPVW
jgi:hypothetical protein